MDIYSKLEAASAFGGTLTVINTDGTESIDWCDIFIEAELGAGWLRDHGIGPGSVVVTAARTSRKHIVAILATWCAGAAITVNAVPLRSRRSEALRSRFHRLRGFIKPDLVLGDEDHLATLIGKGDDKVKTLEEWFAAISGPNRSHQEGSLATTRDDSIAILQPTSGTTGFPKISTVPYGCLDANHRAIISSVQLDPRSDTMLSWLPLSHDMGLVGFMATPLTIGANLVIADPSLFAAQPANWMSWCADYQATVTGGPSFAYGIAASLMKERKSMDLSKLRLAMNGAERVDIETCNQFVAAGSKHQLKPSAVFPVYGLAEATLAVTFPKLGVGLETDIVDSKLLEQGVALSTSGVGTERIQRMAKLGEPIRGMEVEIASSDGAALKNREVGNILIRGSSVIPGYFGQKPFGTGWFDTGDLGYLADNQLVVCGREKDLIVVAGRNIYPEEIERALSGVTGVWRGNVAAFSTTARGREAVVVVAEATIPTDKALANRLRDIASDWCDSRIADVHLIEPGSMPKTPSGKISRLGCRSQYETNRK